MHIEMQHCIHNVAIPVHPKNQNLQSTVSLPCIHHFHLHVQPQNVSLQRKSIFSTSRHKIPPDFFFQNTLCTCVTEGGKDF